MSKEDDEAMGMAVVFLVGLAGFVLLAAAAILCGGIVLAIGGVVLATIIGVAASILFMPGMVSIIVISNAFSLRLDTGQMWTFAIVISPIFYLITLVILSLWDPSALSLRMMFSGYRDRVWKLKKSIASRRMKMQGAALAALGIYISITVVTIPISLVAHYGFHSAFPKNAIRAFGYSEAQPAAVSSGSEQSHSADGHDPGFDI